MNGVFRFNGSDSGESPTGSTLSLIFDGLDVTFVGPINIGSVNGVFSLLFSIDGSSFDDSQISGFEFGGGQVGEFVQGVDGSVVGGVQGSDFVEVLSEDA